MTTKLIRPLGAWKVAGNTCHATLSVDRPRSLSIALEWSREPGPTENEQLDFVLPHIVGTACAAVEEIASISQIVVDLIAEGKVYRSEIKDGWFGYSATDSEDPNDDSEDPNETSIGD